ncbi:hypothetical protein GCM10023213_47630 [Prosthecobacter algae]|uniref:DUF3945 domain-containing protein n=1 Tax=Prosthecobacter algae TaxID=1144682 RepID=A0ABP9PTR0_9BACT
MKLNLVPSQTSSTNLTQGTDNQEKTSQLGNSGGERLFSNAKYFDSSGLLMPTQMKQQSTKEQVFEKLEQKLGQKAKLDPSTKLETKQLPDYYKNEEEIVEFRGAPENWEKMLQNEMGNETPKLDILRTRYMDTEEMGKHEIFFKDGKLVNNEGVEIDTTAKEKIVSNKNDERTETVESGPTGIGTQLAAGRGKHIFAVSDKGTVRSVDPWAAKQISDNAGEDWDQTSLDFVNHSSLVKGGSVAGAGELVIKQGELHQVSDSSGHYQPNNNMVAQTLKHFEHQGVDLSQVDVKLVGKGEGQTPIFMSSEEFLLRNQDQSVPSKNDIKSLKAELKGLEKEERNIRKNGFEGGLEKIETRKNEIKMQLELTRNDPNLTEKKIRFEKQQFKNELLVKVGQFNFRQAYSIPTKHSDVSPSQEKNQVSEKLETFSQKAKTLLGGLGEGSRNLGKFSPGSIDRSHMLGMLGTKMKLIDINK